MSFQEQMNNGYIIFIDSCISVRSHANVHAGGYGHVNFAKFMEFVEHADVINTELSVGFHSTNINLSNKFIQNSRKFIIKKLSIERINIDSMLNNILDYQHLTELYLYHCIVGNLNIVNLKILDLYDCKYPRRIENIDKLTKLERLALNNYPFDIPEELYNLTNIRELYLGSCSFEYLSSDIKNLINLKGLNLSYANITNLPEEICYLPNLEIINLSSSKIEILPKGFNKFNKIALILTYSSLAGEVARYYSSCSYDMIFEHSNKKHLLRFLSLYLPIVHNCNFNIINAIQHTIISVQK